MHTIKKEYISNFIENYSPCIQNSFFDYTKMYGSQIIACLVYDSIIDLCNVELMSDIASFVIGVTYLSSYDLEKCIVLLTFIGFSLLVISVCKIFEKLCSIKISILVYTALVFSMAIFLYNGNSKFYNMEKYEHCRILSLAFMKFTTYTTNVVNNRFLAGFRSYFSWHFLGYMFNPVNILHGPWLPLDIYERVYLYKKRVVYNSIGTWDKYRVWSTTQYCLISFCFYALADCVLPRLSEKNDNLWFGILCKCMQFRFMHYAHCHLCSAAMICSGQHVYLRRRKFPITLPWNIEFPVSLSTALISCDKQLILFVSDYFSNHFEYMRSIYSRSDLITLPLIYLLICFDNCSAPIAVLTFFIFAHTQGICQAAIANSFSICVTRYPCKPRYCPHRLKQYHPVTLFVKTIFLIWNMIVINYITIALVDNNYKNVWNELDYIGHHIFTAYFLIGLIIIDFNPQIVQLDRRPPNAFERNLGSSGYKELIDKAVQTDIQENKSIPYTDSKDMYKKKTKEKKSAEKKGNKSSP